MKKKKTIGIIGGMGPEATVDIFNWIVKLTPAKKDEDHIRIIIDNNPQIPNRVNAILHNGKSPLPALKESAKKLEDYGVDFLIIPCNTASYYIHDLRKHVQIPVLSIVDETVKYVSKQQNIKTVGILGTEATLRIGLYQECLINEKIESIYDENHHEIFNDLINSFKNRYYSTLKIEDSAHNETVSILTPKINSLRKYVVQAISGKKGIKAGYHAEPKNKLIIAANELKKRGADAVILGCTEIPLALHQKDVSVTLINPTKVLAQASVDYALK